MNQGEKALPSSDQSAIVHRPYQMITDHPPILLSTRLLFERGSLHLGGHDSLSSWCSALTTPQVGCCFRTWALMMAVATHRLCLQSLSKDLFTLPQRCGQLHLNQGLTMKEGTD